MIKELFSRFQKKSGSSSNLTRSDLSGNQLLTYDLFNRLGWHDVKATLAWSYWAQVQPIKRATNLLSNEFSSIDFVLFDKQTKEFIKEFDPRIPESRVLNNLKMPNGNKTAKEFKKSNFASYIVTGESYIMITGMTDIQEIWWINPSDVTVFSENDNFYPDRFVLTFPNGSMTFNRDQDNRYFTSNKGQELYQIIDFNPFFKIGNQRGFSCLSSIFFEIEQYISGNVHNISQLKKGARPSGILLTEESITSDQIQEMKKQIRSFYQGSHNTGNVMVMSRGREFKELSISNKEMEYSKLNATNKQAIYDLLEIPPSFYDNSAATFNNKMQDRINLYLFGVLPQARRLAEEFTKAFMPRFKNGDRYEITFIEKTIPALELMFDESNLRKANSGVFTINELRERYGLEDIGTPGDVLYQPFNLVPVGSTVDTEASQNKMKEVLEQKYKYNPEQVKAILDVINIDRQRGS